jgi:hypothetical protein
VNGEPTYYCSSHTVHVSPTASLVGNVPPPSPRLSPWLTQF